MADTTSSTSSPLTIDEADRDADWETTLNELNTKYWAPAQQPRA
jgi:hypothetical protein